MKIKMPELIHHPASFRDPSGFIFNMDGVFYRQVNQSYATDYDLMNKSGLYRILTDRKLLIPHDEKSENLTGSPDHYKALLPVQIANISYPSEWSPAQLKDAALLTLNILEIAIAHGMVLKDATPLNIQFVDGYPIWIDSLSLERYDSSRPWVAYRQFCECFLFPLYINQYLKTGTHHLFSVYPDGIPAAAAAKLLPFRSIFRAGAHMHLFMLKTVRHDGRANSDSRAMFSEKKFKDIAQHLKNIITSFQTGEGAYSSWSGYYEKSVLSETYLREKERIFQALLLEINCSAAIDIGANNGRFSVILAQKKMTVVAIDSAWQCINELYVSAVEQSIKNVLPLCIDIANPTPATGFMNEERPAFTTRIRADLVVALALIHHLIFGSGIPLRSVALCFAGLTQKYLIVEFVPFSDDKVQELVRNKDRYHPPCDQSSFEDGFGQWFTIMKRIPVAGSERTMYLMEKKEAYS